MVNKLKSIKLKWEIVFAFVTASSLVLIFQNCSRIVAFRAEETNLKVASVSANGIDSQIPESGVNVNNSEEDPNYQKLSCAQNKPNLQYHYSQVTQGAALPDIPSSPDFVDDVGGIGQEWVQSNPVNDLEGQIQIWSTEPNAGYSFGSKLEALDYPNESCEYYYKSFYLTKGTPLSLRLVRSVFGSTVKWLVVGINGHHFLWKAITKDYSLDGGHNAVSAFKGGKTNGQIKTGKCTGQIVGPSKMNSGHAFAAGGCIDFAQQHPEINCVEIPDGTLSQGGGWDPEMINRYCRFFDGPAEERTGTDLSYLTLHF